MEQISSPLVSVIMPVYNAEKYLREAIESTLNQTFTNFEFLIFNDGSTDSSLQIIQSYVSTDSRIVLAYNGENKGYVAHLNEGIKIAKGRYIARMDADDISLPERFEKQISFLENNPDYVLCGSRIQLFGFQNQLVTLPIEDEEIRLKMLYITPFAHPSVMIRKEILLQNNLFYNESLMPAEDYDLWTKIVRFGKVYNFKEVLLWYRVHNKNISSKARSKEQLDCLKKTQKEYIRFFFKDAPLSEQEISALHTMFQHTNLNIVVTFDTIEKVIEAIRKIEYQSGNQSNNETLKNFLRQYFFYLCTTSSHLGLKLWWIYTRSGLHQASTTLEEIWHKIKFFLKALIRYKAN
jgi:glycosyltransferase involved in cell wall biosynthesis